MERVADGNPLGGRRKSGVDGEQPRPFAQGQDKRRRLGVGAIAKPYREPDPRDDFANASAEPPDYRFGAQLSFMSENVEQLIERAPHRTARQDEMRKLMRNREPSSPGVVTYLRGKGELELV
jgi:hypothetical protein